MFSSAIYRRGVRYGACSCFFFLIGSKPLAMLLPVFVYLIPLFYLIAIPLSLLLFYFAVWRALVVLVLVLLSELSCTAYMFAFLALRELHVVILCSFRFCFLVFLSKPLPGDDVLCRLLSRPLSTVYFLPCFFVLFCFSPTVFVPGLFCCNFLYLVITAGFVADQ